MRFSLNGAGTTLSATLLMSHVLAKVMQWQIQRFPRVRSLERRAGETSQSVVSNDIVRGGYFANVEIGTPSQRISLQLDTGSSDVWVPSTQAAICQDSAQGGCQLGAFNPEQSSSYQIIAANGFDIAYQDNSSSSGDYFADRFAMGQSTLSNLTMGLGKKTDVPFGLIGVGYANNEASAGSSSVVYPNLPIAMQQAGLISSVAYSLWLNDLQSSTGSILFGGVDTDKFTGDLVRISIIPDSRTRQYTRFGVSLFSIQADSPSGNDTLVSNDLPLEVVLDSGTTLSYLSPSLAQQIWDEVGAVYDSSLQVALVPCSYANHAGHFSFLFSGASGPRIRVAMNELVLSLANGAAPKFPSGPYRGQAACEFGIQSSASSPYLLGDTFLRSAYVVYDLSNNEIGMAPTNFNSSTSNVVAFQNKGAAIPSSTYADNSSTSNTVPQASSNSLTAAKGLQADSNGSSDRLITSGLSRLLPAFTFFFIHATMSIAA